jgi:hypothetical protein
MSEDAYDPDRPWDRQPCDSPQSWGAFRLFLASTPRSLRGVARDLPGVSLATVERWAEEGVWEVRAECHDRARASAAPSLALPAPGAPAASSANASAPAAGASPAEQRALLASMIALCTAEIAKFAAVCRRAPFAAARGAS